MSQGEWNHIVQKLTVHIKISLFACMCKTSLSTIGYYIDGKRLSNA